MPTILFVGGGSLGHITPSVAVWEAVQQQDDSLQAHFVCSPKRVDMEYLKQAGLPYSPLDAPRFGFSFLWKFWPAVRQARQILDDVQPDIIFSKGGHVSVPVCYLAKKRRIPIVMHESDAVMGRANRLVAELADTVCLGMHNEDYGGQKIQNKYIFTGNPIRENMTQGSKQRALKQTGLSGTKPILLVIGGSQGAQDLNNAVEKLQSALLDTYDIIHVTGLEKHTAVAQTGYYQTEFSIQSLADFYAAADVAVSRAGSNMTAELQANDIPTVLVPLRGVGHDHQQKNAEALSTNPIFTLLQQSELEDKLIPTLKHMSNITDQSAATPTAAENPAQRIAEIVLEALDSSSSPH